MTTEERRIFDAGVAFGRVSERMERDAEESSGAMGGTWINLAGPVDDFSIDTTKDFARPMSVVEAERPKLTLVPCDEHTAEVFNLPFVPTNGNSAA